MQKVLIGFLAVTTAALSILCGVQWQQLQAAKERVRVEAEARAVEVEAREAQVARLKELERNEVRLERQLQDFSKVTTTLRASEAAQSSNLTKLAERVRGTGANGTNSAEGEGMFGKGMGDMLGKMMKDPAMRDMMREQQKAVVTMMYSGLFKELNLSPEEKDKFKALLTDAQMRNIEAAQGLWGGDDKTGTEDTGQKLTAAKKQTDDEMKALLGDERFAQYQDYQKNMGERMQLDSFQKQLAGNNTPLREEQSAQLMQILKEEKAAMPPAIPTDQTQIPKKESFTPEKVEQQLQWMTDYNQRVAERARTVLNPDQFKEYLAFQEQQTAMQKLGLNMARQMFGGSKPGEPGPAK